MDNISDKEHEIIELDAFHKTEGDIKMINMILIHKKSNTKY